MAHRTIVALAVAAALSAACGGAPCLPGYQLKDGGECWLDGYTGPPDASLDYHSAPCGDGGHWGYLKAPGDDPNAWDPACIGP